MISPENITTYEQAVGELLSMDPPDSDEAILYIRELIRTLPAEEATKLMRSPEADY